MPIKKQHPPGVSKRTYLRHGYEKVVSGLLLRDGWQVFLPQLDDSHATDMIVSDGADYHRIQVKTTERNRRVGSIRVGSSSGFAPPNIIIVISVTSDWGLVFPRGAAASGSLSLSSGAAAQFQWQKPKSFIKAFNAV
jgi:hypothetical protein